MERTAIKANLHRIIAIAKTMQLPGSDERIMELANHALHMIERDTDKTMRFGLIVAALADSIDVSEKGAVKITDPNLFRKIAKQAVDEFPKEG